MKPDTAFTNEIMNNQQFNGEYKPFKYLGNTYYYYTPDFNKIYMPGHQSLPNKKVEIKQETKKELRKIRCSED